VRRTAVAIVLLTAACVVAARMTAWAARPLLVMHSAGLQINDLEARLGVQQDRKRRLLAEIDYLKTPTGVEEEARRQGWVKDGETAIQVILPEHENPSQEGSPPQRPRLSPLQRCRLFLDSCLSGLEARIQRP
jgi:cell division protein FtsB